VRCSSKLVRHAVRRRSWGRDAKRVLLTVSQETEYPNGNHASKVYDVRTARTWVSVWQWCLREFLGDSPL